MACGTPHWAAPIVSADGDEGRSNGSRCLEQQSASPVMHPPTYQAARGGRDKPMTKNGAVESDFRASRLFWSSIRFFAPEPSGCQTDPRPALS